MQEKNPEILKEAFDKNGKRLSPMLSSEKVNFIIDIDGVVCEDVPNEEIERMKTACEIPGSKEKINNFYNEGNIITFFTARTEDLKEITTNWLNQHGFKYHKIIFGKPRGGNYHYIDDRDIRATKFNGKFTEFVYKDQKIKVFE